MKVRYLLEVVTPEHLSGKPGDVRDVDDKAGNQLASEGYVEVVGDHTDTTVVATTEE